MKHLRTALLSFGAALLATVQPAAAAPVTPPADGDIFLGFRASAGDGANSAYLVKVGNETAFTGATPGATQNLSTLGADLAAIYGANWHTRTDLHWGVFGTRNNPNPSVFASRAQNPLGTPAPDYQPLSSTARASTKNQIISVVTAYQGLQATANNAAAARQDNALTAGSYNFQITGGTTSFGSLSGWTDIEGSFANGAASTALDLFRLSGTTAQGDVVTRVGTFAINSSGAVSFTAAPLLNKITLKQINYSVQEDAGSVTLAFVRSGDLSQAITATFALTNGSAVSGTDFTLPANLVLNFAAGQAEATAVVNVLNRPTYVGNRTFTASLVSATGGFSVRAPAQTTVTIADIDPASTLQWAQSAVQIRQFVSNTAELTVSRVGVSTGSISVQASVTGGTLIGGTHFNFTSPVTLTFLSGDVTKTVSIPLTGSVIPGTIEVSLANPQGSTAIAGPATATVSVVPNSGTLAFAAATFSANTATPSVNLNLTRSSGSTGIVSVDVSVSGGSLVNGTDFTFTSPTTVNFADGATTASVAVPLTATGAGDITFTLSNPTGAADLGAQAQASIVVAGAPGTLAFGITEFNVLEEAGTLNIPVLRTGGSLGAVSVLATTSPGTATAGDFTALNGFEVSFADGVASVSVPVSIILDNVKNEPNETFTLTLSGPTGGASLGANVTATIRILDLDAVKPTVVLTTPKANVKIKEADGPAVIVSGTAKDNKGVAKVEVKFNDGPYVNVLPLTIDSKGVASFSHEVEALPGNNLISVRSTDFRGNVSTVVTRSFNYADPFPAIAGIYTGLVGADGETTATNSTEGLISITITATGTFSGKLTIDSFILPFSGSIATSGAGQFGKTLVTPVPLVRKGKTPLNLALQFDLAKTGNTNRVTGSVVDGPTVSALVAHRALYTNKKNPAAPFVNPLPALVTGYTVLFKAAAPGAPNPAAEAFPQGDGWGSVTVSNAGVAKITATLADGSAFTYSAPLSITNQLPFYVQLYKKLGSISGPVKFENLAFTDLDGEDLFWFRPADAKSKVYPGGWPTGITTDLRGSKFVKSAKTDTESVLGFAGAGTLTASQGTLAEPVVKGFSITPANKVTNDGADKTFTLTVAGATGIFSGSFTAPAPQKKPAFKGVILQKSGEASGFFLSTATPQATSQSGKVTLTEVNE